MSEPGEKLVRLSVELPAGVTIKTRSKMPTLEVFGGVMSSLFAGKTAHEYRSTTPTILELEFPEAIRPSILEALKKFVTVGRL